MKPFDLQKALAGDPVVTKHGEKVEQLHLFKLDGDYQFPLVCVVKGCMHFFDEIWGSFCEEIDVQLDR